MTRRPTRPLARVFHRVAVGVLGLAAIGAVHAAKAAAQDPPVRHRQLGSGSPAAAVDGTVLDSTSNQPLEHAELRLLVAGRPVATTTTSALGRYELAVHTPGPYEVEARRIGFASRRKRIAIADGTAATLDFALPALATTLGAVTVEAARSAVAVDARTGNQLFKQDAYHGAPATTTTQIVQQALAGAARAPTGEVHIRGQHGEFTYYVDGLPVPPGISGSLSDLFAPAVVERIEFQTGGWDAEYGNRNTAVIRVDTRVPAGGLRAQGSIYAGSYGTTGQSLTTSGNVGPLGLLLSGSAQSTEMRRDPVMAAPAGRAPLNFHNAGEDRYLFGKARYVPGARDLVTLDVDVSRARFEIPFDSAHGVTLDDHQRERNGFANLGWRHALGASTDQGELFIGAYRRESHLLYVPGAADDPTFVFHPDTVSYTVAEDRSAGTTGVRADLLLPTMGAVQLKTGFDVSRVLGHEHFITTDARGGAGPSVDASVRGGDVGVYAQASVHPVSWWELRPGVRYDVHAAPVAGGATQVSPRLRLNLFPGPTTSAWLYYGRLFVPSAVEDFHVLASAGQGGAEGQPTRPERDHFFEAGIVQRLPDAGVTVKLDAYHKRSAPAVDDNTLPGTALTATVNVATVRVTGIESVLEVQPGGSLSGYLNVALSHAAAHGPITGGFSPTAYPAGWYDMDHDQRLSVVSNLVYDRRDWYASATGIYGSGLTNGNPSAGETRLGLLDFNRAVKVAPSFVVNAAVGTVVQRLGLGIRPQLFVDNVFDRRYVLKGAFTSGASVGRPRTLVVRVDVGR